MEHMYTANQVAGAVNILFNSRTQYEEADIREADEFLKRFCKSHQAWVLCIQMLLSPTEMDTVMLF
jgi:glutaredoxin-related protein